MSESGPDNKPKEIKIPAEIPSKNPFPEKGHRKFFHDTRESWHLQTDEAKEKFIENFFLRFETYSQDAQDLVSSLSSSFLEQDVKKTFINDPANIDFLRRTLKDQKLSEKDIDDVFTVLQITKDKDKNK